MHEINLSADELVDCLLGLPSELNLCLLDSCGVSNLNSHLLIAGINPVEQIEITNDDAEKSLEILEQTLARKELSAMITISYDFGLKLNRIQSRHKNIDEPDIFLALFDTLIIHDYATRKTYLRGNEQKFGELEKLLVRQNSSFPTMADTAKVSSNFTRQSYVEAVEKIKEFIRCGDTYQTNLTQQIRAVLPKNLAPEMIFRELRTSHPAAFASFLRRKNDIVVSASPERFFMVENAEISTSPIKGTRPRGKTSAEDSALKNELLTSEKERAENIMIVDLLRNDLGRICEFGSVAVEKLCHLEEHPTLFHLVSTISGQLKSLTKLSDILRATFPCGSITGAPKIRTMQLIDQIETASRGLSMGAIGIVDSNTIDFNVAIRTMTIRGHEAIFNVGGGVVIDSLAEDEYDETLTKAMALLCAIGANEIEH